MESQRLQPSAEEIMVGRMVQANEEAFFKEQKQAVQEGRGHVVWNKHTNDWRGESFDSKTRRRRSSISSISSREATPVKREPIPSPDTSLDFDTKVKVEDVPVLAGSELDNRLRIPQKDIANCKTEEDSDDEEEEEEEEEEVYPDLDEVSEDIEVEEVSMDD